MENEGFVFSTVDFDAQFQKIVNSTMPDKLGRGLFHAGAKLLSDAIRIPPQAPHRMGALWRSQQVNKEVIDIGKIEVDAGFNIVYAAYQHEGMRRDGSHVVERYSISRTKMVPKGRVDFGPKFLSKKLAAYRREYMKIAADYCLKD
jgi:hypothetical protein